MIKIFIQSIRATIVLTVLLCALYPLAVTGVAQALFNNKANGGLVQNSAGTVVGAHLIGQLFTSPKYFHGRPSAAGLDSNAKNSFGGYDAANSTGTNYGPTNQKLSDELSANIDTVLKENPTLSRGHIPVDMITSSASGLDPHISPETALAQVDRVARARAINPETLKALVAAHTEGPQFGLFGEPVVNVLELNLALDQAK